MSIAELFHSVQETSAGVALRESALVYPIILSTHLTSIAIFGGMILMTNLRILGLVMRATPVSQLYLALRPWKRMGFVIMVTCGVLLAGCEADKYYPNPIFWTKMTLLATVFVHAMIFRSSVYANPRAMDVRVPPIAKIAAVTSMLLWLSIMSAGRWIAYWDPPIARIAPTSQLR